MMAVKLVLWQVVNWDNYAAGNLVALKVYSQVYLLGVKMEQLLAENSVSLKVETMG
jgi:hypothetical protein